MWEVLKRECGRVSPQLCTPVRHCTAVICPYMPGIQQSILSLALVRSPYYRGTSFRDSSWASASRPKTKIQEA